MRFSFISSECDQIFEKGIYRLELLIITITVIYYVIIQYILVSWNIVEYDLVCPTSPPGT